MACADISSARCSVVGSCCCRQLGLEGFYCCGVNSIRQFVPLPCCSGEERVVVVILGAHWDLVLVAVCIFVVLVYRPPDASLSNFFDITNRIETTLLENNASASDILLLGDFNLPHIKWDNGHASNNATAHGRLLLAITELFYLEQIVDKPTRVNNILDLVFCPHTVSNGCNILPTGISVTIL